MEHDLPSANDFDDDDFDDNTPAPAQEQQEPVPSAPSLNTPKGVFGQEEISRDSVLAEIDKLLKDIISDSSKISSFKDGLFFHEDFDREMDRIRMRLGEASEAQNARQRYHSLSNRLLHAVGIADAQKYKVQSIKVQIDTLKKIEQKEAHK